MVIEPRKKAANAHRRKEGLLIRATTKQEKQCRVRSETNDPCLRPAVVEVRGVPFCEPCAREQEAYFAIGEITGASSTWLDDEESLVDMLEWLRRIRRRRRTVGTHEPDAA
jgi:hypothetical protein